MTLKLAIPKESDVDEKRVALTPALIKFFRELGVDIELQTGAGEGIFCSDQMYSNVHIVSNKKALYETADIILQVQPPMESDIEYMKEGAILISFFNTTALTEKLQQQKVIACAMERIPRISRAQNMDALSSQASIVGYKSALIAANTLKTFLPMMTTAAGTIRPSKILVIGVGVAGLQAIATAHRLGAIVEAYDVRPETKEQAESLGARFIETSVSAAGSGGYARELTSAEKEKQKAILLKHFAAADAIICTAGVPGKPAPKIITHDIVAQMKPGSVIVDAMAESGGNCELTKPNETITHHGVTICGPTHLPSTLAIHASEMYSKNCLNFLKLFVKDGKIEIDWEDEVLRETCFVIPTSSRHPRESGDPEIDV